MTVAPKAEPVTLHERIRANIEEQILAGVWLPGHRIPYEHELTAQFACARMTVNKAIASLVDAGLIVRRRRVGSFVAQPKIHSVVLDVPDIQADVTSRGAAYGLTLLSHRRRKPARGQPDEVLLAGKGDLLAVRCLHLADGRPFALEDRLISLAAVPDAVEADFSVTPPGTWLLEHVPWTEAEHRIAAVNADAETAKLLAVAEATACLSLERKTWRSDQHVTHVRQIFPGDSYDLIARFTPRAGE